MSLVTRGLGSHTLLTRGLGDYGGIVGLVTGTKGYVTVTDFEFVQIVLANDLLMDLALSDSDVTTLTPQDVQVTVLTWLTETAVTNAAVRDLLVSRCGLIDFPATTMVLTDSLVTTHE